MTTRSRGRALQEITNVEDQEKQPAKKQVTDWIKIILSDIYFF